MHTIREKKKLIARVRRIRGQLDAVERCLALEKPCSETLQTLAAARGALSGLVAEVIAEHVQHHVLDPAKRPSAAQQDAVAELMDVVRAYVR
jgi:DNA-binding FrmR family transcriptional regulator